jgi:hypothetical protein
MALFTSYAPPGVYTNVVLQNNSAPTLGTARIPVIIGEGQQFFNAANVELFRGSSAVQDDQSVNENISNQVTGLTRNFQTSFFPVTDGTGRGVITNTPSKVQVTAIDPQGNVTPVTVISLDGATGAFTTQLIIPSGFELLITYFFKRGDTFVSLEDLSPQVPTIAKQTVAGSIVSPPSSGSLVVGLSTPGKAGNLVTLQFVAGTAVVDALAVSGAGTNAITINITKPSGTRTLADLATLITAGIPTLNGGSLTVGALTGLSTNLITETAAVVFAGGLGGSSDTVFKVAHTPVVDGTNGGVTTTDVSKVSVLYLGNPVTVVALDGLNGLVTLATPILAPINPSDLQISYFYNTWQNTFDLLPAANVQSILEVGLGPNRSDFVQGTDFVLGSVTANDGTTVQTINWGASVSEAIGQSAAGESANFTPAEILTTLVDEHVYLQKLTGAVDGKNVTYIIPDVVTDGSGQSKATDDPTLINVYVGSDPLEAFLAGAVKVARLSGQGQSVTLYNPPYPNTSATVEPLESVRVWASYYRNRLTDHQYTVRVKTAGYQGAGTYTITDEIGRVAPLVTFDLGASSVADNVGFQATTNNIVYPQGYPDIQAVAGAAIDETVTLTFRNDGNSVVTPAVPASLALVFGSGTLTFTAQLPGEDGNNVKIVINASDPNPIPVVVSGDTVTIYSSWAGSPLTLAEIKAVANSTAETTSGGQISCVASGVTSGNAAITASTPLAGGTNAVTAPVSHSYVVSSNQAKGSGTGPNNIGYLDQTYVDSVTGFRITVVNPADAVAFGAISGVTTYVFAPTTDHLVFHVFATATDAIRNCGSPNTAPAQSNNLLAIPGLHTTVVSDFGSTAGDTVIISTFNKSGNNPSVGEFYFVSFTVAKTAADYAIKLYTDPAVAYAVYGQPSTINRVSLAIQLMSGNGVQTFGVIQVPVVPGTNQGSSSDFMNAIASLKANLPGTNQKANIVCPLSTDPSVHQFLSRQLTTMANIRQKGEAIGFVGYDQFQTPATMRANARSLSNKRVVAIGAPVAGIIITNPTTGVAVEYAVSGEFMAAAMMGLEANPANDVAQSLTFQNLVGFSRLLTVYDDPTLDAMAADGLTDLLNNNGSLLIRHYKSTDPSNPLTSEPTVTTITDYVSQIFRTDLNQFIGRKLLDSLVTDIQVVCNARLKSLVDQQIISGYQNLSVKQDPTDPTQADVTVTFKPMFCLLYVSVTFVVQTQLS